MVTEEERKAKQKGYDKAWRDANKAKKLASQKAWRDANKAKRAAYQKAWRDAYPDKVKAYEATPKQKDYDKAWREANKDKVKAYEKARIGTPERKASHKAYRKAWRDANTERLKAYEKARGITHRLKREYGITLQQRDEIILAQGNRCLCCKTLFGLLRAHQPRVDHCHRTGKVRGILCNLCNTLLGHADDVPSILLACARYLERHARSDRASESNHVTTGPLGRGEGERR